MLRKSFLVAALIAAPGGVAMAHDTGCGAGTILWEGQSGVAAEVLAVTTNGTFGNQTFGISSGSLGCTQGGVVRVAARIPMYASANMDRIAADMAAGHGESLAALAELYGIPASDRQAFYDTTRAHFGDIFARENVTVGQMLQSLESVMSNNDQLAQYVS